MDGIPLLQPEEQDTGPLPLPSSSPDPSTTTLSHSHFLTTIDQDKGSSPLPSSSPDHSTNTLAQSHFLTTLLVERVTRWRVAREDLIAVLRARKAELIEIHKKVNICKVAGSSTSIAGGVLAIVGLGLVPFTFGSSLALTVTGSVLCGAGGIASAAPSVWENVAQAKTNKAIAEKVELDQQELTNICEKYKEMYPHATSVENILSNLLWTDAKVKGAQAIFQAVMVVKHGAWNMVISPIHDGATTVVVAGATAGLHSLGFALSAIMLPVDIACLAMAAKDLHQKNIPDICNKIEDIIVKLETPLLEARQLAKHISGGAEPTDDQISRAFLMLLIPEIVVNPNTTKS